MRHNQVAELKQLLENPMMSGCFEQWYDAVGVVLRSVRGLDAGSKKIFVSIPKGEPRISMTVGGRYVTSMSVHRSEVRVGFSYNSDAPELEAQYGEALYKAKDQNGVWYEGNGDLIDIKDFIPGMIDNAQSSSDTYSVSPYRQQYGYLHIQRLVDAWFAGQSFEEFSNRLSTDAPRDRNFFLFQSNPELWDLAAELKRSDVHEWGVNRLGKEMAPGDLVILWASGERRGAYGVARLMGEVRERTKQDELSGKFTECVDLEVVRDWSDAPILAEEVAHFGWMPKSFQGTNFRSTAEAVFGLMEYWHRRDEGVGKRVWKIAPGEDSKYWAAFKEKQMASIGWDIGNLSNIETEEEMEALVKAKYGNDSEGKKPTARTLFAINRRMLKGDYLVAKDGFAGYHGLGVITSEYKYLPYDDDVDCHRVEADWFDVNHRAPCFKQHRQTLVEITERLDELQHIARLYGFDFEGVTGMRPAKTDFFADSFVPREDVEAILNGLRTKKNVILQGPPGTGKTFIAKRLAYEMMGERDPARLELVQFHQSYSYEDFIQGYRPRAKGGFELRNGVFHRFCARARRDLDRPYFFLIDEINRGNLSKIFGELMMLIEADKRGEEVQLTYSAEGERFSIPPNVHLIGTMNTADRSLAMVDYALRRRFAFFDMPPRLNERFAAHLEAAGLEPAFVKGLVARLEALNAVIRTDANLGKGFEIGHSYFCGGVPEGLTAREWLDEVVEQEVGPQLREFWFDDQAKAEGQIASLQGQKP